MMTVRALICLAIIGVCFAWKAPTSLTSVRGRSLSMLADGRKALMGGNWKMNPTTVKTAEELASGLASTIGSVSTVDAILFPPFPLLPTVHKQLANTHIKLGAQDCYTEVSGAFTGAVSTDLLKDMGVSYILIGHSERRTIFKEDDSVINKKVHKVLKDGLKPVLCIGESKDEYEAGLNQEICGIQLMKGLKDVTPEQVADIVIAYEPVWAIGTGLTCPKEVAQDVHHFIRSRIAKKFGEHVAKKVIIQYGGSANEKNVKELMSMPDIDGCLVGGASLKVDSFSKIVGYENL